MGLIALCNENLDELPASIDTPGYPRDAMKAGILHIGPSNFFRAHLAVFADRLLRKAHEEGRPLDWGIIGVSMKHPDTRDALAQQDFLSTVVAKNGGPSAYRVVGSIKDIMVASENPDAVLEAAADPEVKVISLTVTQAGYYYDENKGFDFENPDIKACLDERSYEMSSIGLIVSALDLRRKRGIAPPTIMSCDNLAGNGTILRNAVLAYAEKKSPDLKEWIEEYVAFPSNMVDRITPGTRDADVKALAEMGVQDRLPVQAERMPGTPFVIENKISRNPYNLDENGDPLPVDFPDFASVGAIVANHVHPYETMKVRSLNGAHMAMGCIGHLMAYQYSFEAINDLDIRMFIKGFMSEVGQTLKPTDGIDHDGYREDLIHRFENPKVCDPLTRLARNGCEKLPSRFLDTLRDTFASGNMSRDHLTFAIAAWVQYAKNLDGEGRINGAVNDSKIASLGVKNIINETTTDPSPIFAIKEIFGSDLSGRQDVIAEVGAHLELMENHGMKQALRIFVESHLHQAYDEIHTPKLANGGEPADPNQGTLPFAPK